jgi:hypothetical protein
MNLAKVNEYTDLFKLFLLKLHKFFEELLL